MKVNTLTLAGVAAGLTIAVGLAATNPTMEAYIQFVEARLAAEIDTMDQSIAALTRVANDPAQHRRAAYDVAREYLAHDRVLPPMIDAIFATSRDTAPIAPSI
jgi:hypothetical protein